MATAGEGAASYEGGGAGGKFRKRPFRRSQVTPYARPPTALRNPSSNSLFSKLVDPASKLIYAGAHRLFGVFRKRLPPPPPQRPPETNQEPRDRLQETVTNDCCGAPEPGAADQGGNLLNISDATEISELEKMLKQKTFTRSEIDRLTALLHSRTVDIPAGAEDKKDEASLPSTVSVFSRHEASTGSPLNKNRNERDCFHATSSTPVVNSRVLEEDVASPAELAKAYMGTRPSKVSPSVLGFRSQALWQESALLDNSKLLPKTPIMSVASTTANGVGVTQNGFTTTRSRGRSAIYSMARTPYSRVHSTVNQKGIRSTDYGYGGRSSSLPSSQSAREHEGPFGSKQMALKRRISVLDDDIGSVGSVRRIRQKNNILSQGSSLSTRGREFDSAAAQHPVSSQKLLLMNGPTHKVYKAVEENGDTSIHTSSYTSVPSKSSQMATKILQHLEKLTPKDRSPTRLAPNMLHGQALRSLENVDSSKFLHSALDSQKSEDLRNAGLPDARDSTSQKKDKVEESGPRKFSVPRNMLTPVNGDATVSIQENAPIVKTTESILKLPAEPPQKKRAFQMSAHEDSLEMDDDIHSNVLASTSLAESEQWETSVVVSKVDSTEALPEVAKTPALPEAAIAPALPEVKKTFDSVSHQGTDFGTSGGSVVSEKKIGSTFSTSPPVSTTSQSAMLNQSTSAFLKKNSQKESNASPSFSESAKNGEKVSPLLFSAGGKPSGLKSNSWSEPKPESFNSSTNVALIANNAEVQVSASDKGDNNSPQKAVVIVGTLPSSVSAATSASDIFSFGIPVKNSNLNNGTLASSPSFFSSSASVVASSNSTDQFFNNSLSHVASSGSNVTMPSITTTVDSNSGLSTSAVPPIFSLGPSVAPTTSVSTSGAETTDTKVKRDNEPKFSSINSSPFGGTLFAMPSTVSSIFGFTSSAVTSTANNQSRGSFFSTATGSTAATQSTPLQFGSSAASPVSGTFGITSSTSGSSLFSSSNPASANMFSSTASFSLGSAVSSSETNSGSSTTAATTPSIFGSGWQAPKSSAFGSTISSPSTGFSFGASSTSVATTSSAPIVFGSSNTGASSGSSMVSLTSPFPSLSQTQSVFGISTPFFTATSGNNNNDQMNMEDSMAEDTMQLPFPTAVPAFGQPSPAPGFMFGSTAPIPFQFGGQPNQSTSQNLSPFQASGSQDFSGGSFSLGSGGSDKSNRKFVRVSRNRNRKK